MVFEMIDIKDKSLDSSVSNMAEAMIASMDRSDSLPPRRSNQQKLPSVKLDDVFTFEYSQIHPQDWTMVAN